LKSLPSEQKALWPHLAPAKDLGFTLYGGTAIALRLGHRFSVDFDFFTERPLDKDALLGAMPLLARAETLREDARTLLLSVVPPQRKRPVKVSFFAELPLGRYGEPQLTEDGILRVASLDDLMATKLKVILDRVEKKDYDDLAAMIAKGQDVARGLGIARKMYAGLNPEMALKALVYHKDVPDLSARAKAILVKAAKSVDTVPDVPLASASLS
jgi:hypothetical protein